MREGGGVEARASSAVATLRRYRPPRAPGCPCCWWSRPASWTPCGEREREGERGREREREGGTGRLRGEASAVVVGGLRPGLGPHAHTHTPTSPARVAAHMRALEAGKYTPASPQTQRTTARRRAQSPRSRRRRCTAPQRRRASLRPRRPGLGRSPGGGRPDRHWGWARTCSEEAGEREERERTPFKPVQGPLAREPPASRPLPHSSFESKHAPPSSPAAHPFCPCPLLSPFTEWPGTRCVHWRVRPVVSERRPAPRETGESGERKRVAEPGPPPPVLSGTLRPGGWCRSRSPFRPQALRVDTVDLAWSLKPECAPPTPPPRRQ